MVDWNNESTVATPPGEVVKIVVLERREQVIEALEKYHQMGEETETHHQENIVRARLMAFWYQVEAMVRRRAPDDYEGIKNDIAGAKDFADVVACFEWLNKFVDDMGLTFIDGRARYDRTRVEDANYKKGLG